MADRSDDSFTPKPLEGAPEQKPRKPVGPNGPAWSDPDFMGSQEARTLRILAEYLEPEKRFRDQDIKDTIVFFGSARILSHEQAEAAMAAARDDLDAGEDAETQAERLERAELALTMSRYYEDTRELSRRLTLWSKSLHPKGKGRRFVVCSGGGPGIMEAANRGASEAKGMNIGLNIQLPFEQKPNPFITHSLNIDFHYFFMRKFWFAYLAKAMICMPGGFGTFDELTEVLTLIQTLKIKKKMPIVLFGTEFWRDVVDFNALVKYGTISRRDLDLMFRTDSVDEAYEHVTAELTRLYIEDTAATM
ncbi:MAG: LOG family protein [Alphaproteobacteria bacterium]